MRALNIARDGPDRQPPALARILLALTSMGHASSTRSNGLLLLALAAGGVMGVMHSRSGEVRTAGLSSDGCGGGEPCALGGEERTDGRRITRTLSSREACSDAGYLCAQVAERDSMRVLRWPETDRTLTVEVPLPPGLEPNRAEAMRRAAEKGILAWHRYPMSIRVVEHAAPGTADVSVRWTPHLEDRRLGQARTEWMDDGRRIRFRVTDFLLVTASPFDPRVPLSPREIELVAAHEMGHALGLPHSDATRDVMYPENTATRLTARDYKTVEALYRLPGGVLIVRDDP